MRCLPAAAAIAVASSGCVTMTLRAGGALVGDKPAFQASIELGTAVGGKHSVQLTHEHGIAAFHQAEYVGAVNASFVAFGDGDGRDGDADDEPLGRLGARLRMTETSTALEARGCLFTNTFAQPKTHGAGLGFELAAGVDLVSYEPVVETAIVIHSRVAMD